MRKVYIYGLKDPETEIIRYVGKSVNPERRLKAHISRCKNNKYHSAKWIKSLLKKNLKPELTIIEVSDEDNWVEREIYWILKLRESNDLTNFTDGGDRGVTMGRLGKKNSPEHIEKCRKSRVGKRINQNDNNGLRRKGIIRYCEDNEKLVLQFTLDGKFIKEWASAVKCEKETGYNHSNITRSCKTKARTAYGFMWRHKTGEVIEDIEAYVKLEHGSNIEVGQYTKNGELVNKFKSVTMAQNETQISRTSIANNLSGRSKSAGGFIWKY